MINSKYEKLLITGMYRSGTTLLARAFNAHENISFASDVFFNLFKIIRNKFYSARINNFDWGRPMSDKFLEDSNLYNQFLDNCLDIELSENDIKNLIPQLIEEAELNSPKMIPFLKKLPTKPKKARQFLIDLLELVGQCYLKNDLKLVGFKKVWLEEFIGPLVNLDDFYALQIQRDPRAIVASNNKLESGRYPILYVIRQWRKGVAYSIINSDKKRYAKIKFEDLIMEPEQTFKGVCQFLDIPYSNNLVDFDKFKEDDGSQWLQNSSFQRSKSFNPAAIDKWKTALTDKEVELIELLCGPEMKHLGYQLTYSNPSQKVLFDYREEEQGVRDWIKKYDYFIGEQKQQEEIVRLFLLRKNDIKWTKDVIRQFFIDERVFNTLTKIL